MKWQDVAIIIAIVSAFLSFLLWRNAQPQDGCRDGSAQSAEARQLCSRPTP